MSAYRIVIDPERPNPRQLRSAIEALRNGGLITYPTDTVYGLGCDMFSKKSVERVYSLKGKSRKSSLSFICSDLKDIARYAIVSDASYRLMKRILPGPYTIILTATKLVPRVMMSKSSTVGIRVPEHPVPRMLVEELGNPIVTTSVAPPKGTDYNDPDEILRRWQHELELVIDSGLVFPEPSTILDLTDDIPKLLRQGKGEIESLGVVDVVDDT